MPYSHTPVMSDEVIHYLKLKPGDKAIDCTLGGGGHAKAILERTSPNGKLLGIDWDQSAIDAARKATGDKAVLVKDNFKNIKQIANVHQLNKIDGILLDLGLSSVQLQDHERGFSFLAQGKLDMRFGQSEQTDLTAEEILNTYNQKELYEIFKNFGEERLANPITKKIIEFRKRRLIISPNQLVEIIVDVYKKNYRGKSKINPATKIFQALRIAVNQELDNLTETLPQAAGLLGRGGRLVVISYHSLEDKIVKEFFRKESRDCICPPEMPVCQCRHKKTLKIITKKPVVPSEGEIAENPRARSAKLRAAERL